MDVPHLDGSTHVSAGNVVVVVLVIADAASVKADVTLKKNI